MNAPRAPRHRHRYRILGVLLLLAVDIAGAIVLLASPYVIHSISMTNTIQPGQVVLVERVGPTLGLQRGEIVLFHPPSNIGTELFIKRIVGLPGDQVVVSDGHLSVNGVQVTESYLAPGTTTSRINQGYNSLTVPQGSVFVLGDDRSESMDSRYFGPIPEGSIVGEAWMILSPPSFALGSL